MPDDPRGRATPDDLLRVEGQAELIDGRVVRFPLHGVGVGRLVGRLVRSLDDYAETEGRGSAHGSTLAYVVPRLPSGRESFCPDASYYDGPHPPNLMGAVVGPPTFAAEVRGADGYGPAAERAMAAKRADYFEAGTPVVWDVDPEAEVIRSYRAADPDRPTAFARGDEADAEPAVPGWRVAVAAIFRYRPSEK